MTFLRACLFSLLPWALLFGGSLIAGAQPLPAVPPDAPAAARSSISPRPTSPPRNDAAVTQPLPGDSASDGLPGPRPSRIRVLSATDHDLFVRIASEYAPAESYPWPDVRDLQSEST